MPNGFDEVQDELREAQNTHHCARGGAAAAAIHRFRMHELHTDHRKQHDREWLRSPAAARELRKKKYKGKYVYIAYGGVAGYGDSIVEASHMARRRTKTDPAEMIEIMVPLFEVDY